MTNAHIKLKAYVFKKFLEENATLLALLNKHLLPPLDRANLQKKCLLSLWIQILKFWLFKGQRSKSAPTGQAKYVSTGKCKQDTTIYQTCVDIFRGQAPGRDEGLQELRLISMERVRQLDLRCQFNFQNVPSYLRVVLKQIKTFLHPLYHTRWRWEIFVQWF